MSGWKHERPVISCVEISLCICQQIRGASAPHSGGISTSFLAICLPMPVILETCLKIFLPLGMCNSRLRGSRDPSAARPRISGTLSIGIRDHATASGQLEEQEHPSSACIRTRPPLVVLMVEKSVLSSLIYCYLFTALCSAQKPAVQNREINGNSLLRCFFCDGSGIYLMLCLAVVK